MKRISILFFMLVCSLSMFAATGNYTGQLVIVDNGQTSTINPQDVNVIDDGTNVTLTISNFSFAGYTGDVVITATKNASNELSLIGINYEALDLVGWFDETPASTVTDNNCNISLSIWAVYKTVHVTFNGNKVL